MARRGRGKKKNWIARAVGKPGALHKEMGIPEGKTIPEGQLEAAANSENPLKARRARLAMTLKGFAHKKAGA